MAVFYIRRLARDCLHESPQTRSPFRVAILFPANGAIHDHEHLKILAGLGFSRSLVNMVAIIRKVKEPFGCLGNMSAHPIVHGGLTWRTGEALFQALRFAEDDPIRDDIRSQKGPMQAKFVAKSNPERMIIDQCGDDDLANMRIVLRLKHSAHSDVRDALRQTGTLRIVEDCTKRQRGSGLFWGAALVEGDWWGQNWLGKLWMELREQVL